MIDLLIYEKVTSELSGAQNTEDFAVAIAESIGRLEGQLIMVHAEVGAVKPASSPPAPKPKLKSKSKRKK